MFKKCLATAFTVVLMAAGLSTTSYAHQHVNPIKIVDDASVVVQEAAENETVPDVLTAEEITYKVSVPEPDSNVVSCDVEKHGFENWNDYYDRNQSLYMLISEQEDFNNYSTVYSYNNNIEDEDEFVVTTSYSYRAKENATYYVKAAFYNYSTYEYEAVSEAVKVTTKTQRDLKPVVTFVQPEYTTIDYTLSTQVFADTEDYNREGSISFLISEKEDFSEYDTMSTDNKWEYLEDENPILTIEGSFSGKENTTYYIKPAIYNDALNEYDAIADVTVANTKERKPLITTLEVVDKGTGYVRSTVGISGDDSDNFNGYVYIQYAVDKEFTQVVSTNSIYMYSEDKVGEESYLGTYFNKDLSPETTYYIRVAYREYDSSTYTTTYEALSDTVEVTTEADETYASDIIKDEVLREYIAKNLPQNNGEAVWSKLNLEKIDGLNVNRTERSQRPVYNLDGLEYLSNISYVYMEKNEISDITTLTKLPYLTYANLNENNITTIPDFSAMPNLNLELNGNLIPKSEFVMGNTNIPANLISSGYWLENTASSQRTSATPLMTVADKYYNTKANTWPLQVEVTSVRSIHEYTLSVYEGENLLVDNVTGSYNSYSNTVDWVVKEFTTEECTKNLTFVVYVNGKETIRETKDIAFGDSGVEITNSKYILPTATYFYMSGRCYYNSKVVKFEILDAQGAVVQEVTDLYSYVNTNNYDYRYQNIFKVNAITCDYVSFNEGIDLIKYLKEGKYGVRVTFEDGTTAESADILVVTNQPVITGMSMSYSDYSNAVANTYHYIGVSGSNLDFSEIAPAVYDVDGTLVSEVVNYKLTGSTNAIYKVKNISGQEWTRSMEIKLAHDAEYVIANEGENTYKVSLSSYPEIYYVEHNADNDTVKVFVDNFENGEYKVELRTDYSGTVLATSTIIIQDGKGTAAFLNEDGSFYKFDTSRSNYYIRVYSTEDNYSSQSFNNINYASVSSSGNSYYKNINYYSWSYINDGSLFYTSFYLDKSAFDKDAVLSAQLLDEEGNKAADVAVSYEAKTINDGDEVWEVRFSYEKLNIKSDVNYALALSNGEQDLGTGHIAFLDPAKPYWSSFSVSEYAGDMSSVTLYARGYYPENVDTTKFAVRFLSKDDKVVYEATPTLVEKSGNSTNVTNQRYYFTVDIAEKLAELKEYVSLRMELVYDGKVVSDLYLTENDRTISFKINQINHYLSTRNNPTWQKTQVYGVQKNAVGGLKVLVYLPYDAEPIAMMELPNDYVGLYEFKVTEMLGLSYNKFNTRYDFVLVGADGKFYDMEEGYYGAALAFTDLPANKNDWQYVAAEYVFNNDIMSGTSTTTFAPNTNMTRAMFVQTLYNLEKTPAVTYKDSFGDVKSTDWFGDAVTWAVENDITSGIGGGMFGSNNPVSREQLATFLYNYAIAEGYDVSGSTPLNTFGDAHLVSQYAEVPLQWAVNAGIMSGVPQADGTLHLNPGVTATRVQCATMISNFCAAYVD